MKVYEIREGNVRHGAMSTGDKAALHLGGGSNGKDIQFFRKNPAERITGSGLPWVGLIKEAHPVKVHNGYALAKPNQVSDKILVLVSARAIATVDHDKRRTGTWRFEANLCEGFAKILDQATGPKDWYINQSLRSNIGWNDALVVLSVGDVIIVTDENGATTKAKYESVERGLVKQ